MHRSNVAALACGIAGIVTAAWGLSAVAYHAAPDVVLASSFDKALVASDTTWTTTPANVWLSGLGSPGASVGKVITVGDVITINGKGGRPQSIEVTALERIDGARIGLAGVQFQLVTGRSGASPAGRVVRFLFATDTADDRAPVAVMPDRVL